MKCRPVVHARFTAVSWLIALVYRGVINDVTLWLYLIDAVVDVDAFGDFFVGQSLLPTTTMCSDASFEAPSLKTFDSAVHLLVGSPCFYSSIERTVDRYISRLVLVWRVVDFQMSVSLLKARAVIAILVESSFPMSCGEFVSNVAVCEIKLPRVCAPFPNTHASTLAFTRT